MRTRLLTVLVAVLTVVATWAAPAAAEARWSSGSEADADATHTATIVVEEVPDGTTRSITISTEAPLSGLQCTDTSNGWTCDGDTTWRRSGPLGQLFDFSDEFRFQVETPATNGDYPITVRQLDGDGNLLAQGQTVLLLEVVNGQAPPEPSPSPDQSPSPEPSTAPEPSPTSSPSSEDDGQEGATASESPSPATTSPEPSDADPEPDAGDDGGNDDATEDDDPAPRRTTRERSNGTTLGVSPVAPTSSPEPEVDDPAVADNPVIGTPDEQPTDEGPAASASPDDTDADATVAASGSDPTQGPPGRGVPWQQAVGAAMLLTGAMILLWRQIRDEVTVSLPGLPSLPSLPWRS